MTLRANQALSAMLALAALSSIPAADAAAQAKVPSTEAVYHNIKFFKGVPYDQFIPSMYLFADSLGVECEFCHERDRESDAKPAKLVAGKMLRMVERINSEDFGGGAKVTCYTCHRGSVEPAVSPVPGGGSALGGSKGDAKPREGQGAIAAERLSVDAILGRYLIALGGREALAKISNRVERGTVSQNRAGSAAASGFRIEAVSESPGKRITKGFTVSHLGNTSEAYAVNNGDEGWIREGNSPVRAMWNSRHDAARLEDGLNFAPRIGELLSALKVEPAETIAGKETYVVSGRMPALPLVKLYFYMDSGLLARILYHTESVVGPVPTQIDYSDYRAVDGVKVPFQWTVDLVRGVHVTYRLDEVRHNADIDESIFIKPSPVPPLY